VVADRKGFPYHRLTGTIIREDRCAEKAYVVEFDKYVFGFSYDGECADGYGRTVPAKSLKRLRNDPQEVSEKELMKIINKK